MKRACLILALLALLSGPASAAIAVTGPRADGKALTLQGPSVYYTVATVTGALEGTTPVEVTIKLPAPVVSGSLILLVTGDVETAMVVAKLRESRFSDSEADLVSAVSTVPVSGRAAVVVSLSQNVPKDARMSMPAGNYTLRLSSSDVSSAGVVSATLLFVHTP